MRLNDLPFNRPHVIELASEVEAATDLPTDFLEADDIDTDTSLSFSDAEVLTAIQGRVPAKLHADLHIER